MKLTREAIRRMVDAGTGGSGGGGGSLSPSALAGYATQGWVEENFVKAEWFDQVFQIFDDDEKIEVNGELPEDTSAMNIQAMFGFWTNFYVSALGNGGQAGNAILLSQLGDVEFSSLQNGQVLKYNSTTGKWYNANETAGTVTTIKVGNTTYSPTAGVVSLPAYPTVPTAVSAFTNDAGYATSTWVSSQISDMATQTWVNSQISDMATQTWVNTQITSAKTWVSNNFVSIAFFSRLFKAYNGSTQVSPNDTTTTIDNIKAMFGFWTDFYISALGNGGQAGNAIYLSQLQDVEITGSPDGQVLKYSNGKWRNAAETSGTVTAIKIGSTTYLPSAGIVTLPDYPDTSSFATQTWVNTQLGDYLPLRSSAFQDLYSRNSDWGWRFNNYNSETNHSQIYMAHAGGYGMHIRGYSTADNIYLLQLYNASEHVMSIYSDKHAVFEGAISMYSTLSVGGAVSIGGGLTSKQPNDFIHSGDEFTFVPSGFSGGVYFNYRTAGGTNGNITEYYLGNGAGGTLGTIIHTGNIGSQSVAYATSAGSASSATYATTAGSAPASDVYAWAKAATKPSYNLDEVGDGSTRKLSNYLPLAGGTMTGAITLQLSAYYTDNKCGLNCNNSDIIGVNSIYTNDVCDSWSEGIEFKRTNGNWDSFRAKDDVFYFGTNSGTERVWLNAATGSADLGLTLQGANYTMTLCIGNGGTNRGIWGVTSGKWLLYFNSANTILNYGKVGIGTTDPSYKLHVSGDIYATGGVTCLSDARKKDVVCDLPITVDEVANAPAIRFLWKDERKVGYQAGTLAQYWQKVLPEVITDKSGELSMQYGVAALVSVIATARRVVDHEARIKELEAECERLRNEVKQLKKV